MELMNKNLADIIEEITVNMQLQTSDGNNTVVLASNEYVRDRMTNIHGYKDFIFYGKNTDNAESRFTALWNEYKNNPMNVENWKRIYNAFMVNYSPIENYDRTEDTTLTYTGTEKDTLTKSGTETDTLTKSGTETDTLTKSGSETDTLTYNGSEKDTLTKSGSEKNELVKAGKEKTTNIIETRKTTTENQTATDESETYHNDTKSVQLTTANDGGNPTDTSELSFTDRKETTTDSFTDRKDENVKSFTNRNDTNVTTFANRKDESVTTFANRKDESVTTFANRKDESVKEFTNRNDHTISHIHGNVGVTTNQQMITAEVVLRMDNFVNKIIDDFVNMYCTLIC